MHDHTAVDDGVGGSNDDEKVKGIDDDDNDNHPLVSTKLDSKVDLGLAASGHLNKGARDCFLIANDISMN